MRRVSASVGTSACTLRSATRTAFALPVTLVAGMFAGSTPLSTPRYWTVVSGRRPSSHCLAEVPAGGRTQAFAQRSAATSASGGASSSGSGDGSDDGAPRVDGVPVAATGAPAGGVAVGCGPAAGGPGPRSAPRPYVTPNATASTTTTVITSRPG